MNTTSTTEYQVPQLVGAERDVVTADEIRASAIEAFIAEGRRRGGDDFENRKAEFYARLTAGLAKRTSASWWIRQARISSSQVNLIKAACN